MIKTDKETALKAYKEAKQRYLKEMTEANWKSFCEAKTTCMRLGIRI